MGYKHSAPPVAHEKQVLKHNEARLNLTRIMVGGLVTDPV